MVERIETDNADVLAVKVTGTLSGDDYNFLIPAMESEIPEDGKTNLYWEMSDFKGWSPGGLWQDVKFDVAHMASFKKIALVGDQTWEKWLTNLMKPFTTAEVKYFDYANRDEARTWIGL